MATEFVIRQATLADTPLFSDHIQRHFAESGNGDLIFHPIPNFMDRPRDEEIARVSQRLATPFPDIGSEVLWLVLNSATGEIIGHLSLQGSKLVTSRHRTTLGMGLERGARGHGLGSKLMDAAIKWARDFRYDGERLEWIDLYVFAHNKPAIALYLKHGFTPTGTTRDLFRLHGQSIDDIHMVLKL